MKRLNHLRILLLLITFSMPVLAQDNQTDPERGSVQPGFIITLQGDTVKGFLLNINLWMNQHMTFFYKTTDDADGRIKYKPKEIKAYQVGNRFYESMKYPFAYSVYPYNFVLRKVDGPMKLYQWYYNENRAKLMSPDIPDSELPKAFGFAEEDLWKHEFAKKGDGDLITFDITFMVKFAKNMAEYVKDDAELAQKILDKNKGYQSVDIEKIAMEYNNDKLK